MESNNILDQIPFVLKNHCQSSGKKIYTLFFLELNLISSAILFYGTCAFQVQKTLSSHGCFIFCILNLYSENVGPSFATTFSFPDVTHMEGGATLVWGATFYRSSRYDPIHYTHPFVYGSVIYIRWDSKKTTPLKNPPPHPIENFAIKNPPRTGDGDSLCIVFGKRSEPRNFWWFSLRENRFSLWKNEFSFEKIYVIY